MATPKITRISSDVASEISETDELLTTITQDLKTKRSSINQAHANRNPSCYLYKIVPYFKQLDQNAYAPMILSIGPHHYSTRPALAEIEKTKFECLEYLVRLNCKKGLKDYLKAVKGLEEEARSCYRDDIQMDSVHFKHMLLLDASFILVYLHGTTGVTPTKRVIRNAAVPEITEEASDPQVKAGSNSLGDWYYSCLVHDLLLFENQIPFTVVKSLYRVLTGTDDTTNLTNNIASFLEDIFTTYPISIKKTERPKDFQHLLHLLHFYFKPSQAPVQNDHEKRCKPSFIQRLFGWTKKSSGTNENLRFMRWRRALQYHESGIDFVPKEFDENNPNSLLDIKFSSGVVEMPCIRIDQNTTYLFNNFIAMEQAYTKFGNDVTAYIIFISQLMSTSDDVAFLSRKGILSHQLRSDQEASLHLSKLASGVLFDFKEDYYTKEMGKQMEKWYSSRWNTWNAWLKQNHFRNPYMGLIASFAIVVFVCGILQTVVTILTYVKPQTIVLVQQRSGFTIAQ